MTQQPIQRRLFLAAAGLWAWAGPASAGAESLGAKPPKDFPVSFGGPFELVDHTGRTRRDSDFRGRHLLIYFGYTFCPDICPTNLQTMSAALDRLGEDAARIQPLFISVDPARDTVAVLRDYVGHFHTSFVGLTGSEAQVRAVAKAYRVHRSKVLLDGDAKSDDYLVNHSSITFLMGPEGEFVTLFPHDTKADFMAEAIARYLGRSGS
ncbi:MAG: SCO family protein [Kiloniellales bacterium]|nr:SCO family protein [Kiloniellales bacterium]